MNRKKLLLLFLAICIFTFFSYFYFQKSGTTSFVDESDNIVAAHFMLQGKVLFKEVFHNRQLGMVYVSYAIQKLLKPDSLYHLILYHRLFIIASSAFFGTVFILRLGYPALYAVTLFEAIKYYSFGNLFQAEGLIVYPILYLTGLVLEVTMRKKSISLHDTVIAALFIYLVMFMRETYTPLVLLLGGILFFRSNVRLKKIFLLVLLPLTFATLLTVSFNDYVFNLTYVNSHASFQGEVNWMQSFLYPIFVLIQGKHTYTGIVISLMSAAFLITLLFNKKLLFILILALAAIRVVPPGTEYFAAYKMLVWYGLLFFITAFSITRKNKLILSILLTIALIFAVFSPQSIIWQRTNKLNDFDIGYNRYFLYGKEIKKLAKAGNTLYVDGYDSLLFWEAKLPSAYKYTMYYPVMKNVSKYSEERIHMFRTNPPTFYYRDCLDPYKLRLPKFISPEYTRLKIDGKPACLYMLKSNQSEEAPSQ